MTEEEIKNRISEHKECCKKLAEEYRQRYNEDKTNKLALNMFYHNVIAYNNFETVLAMIEDRNSMNMCFAEPPILTEKTVEVELNRIAELEHQLTHRNCIDCSNHSSKLRMRTLEFEKENAELKDDNKVMADNYSKMEQKFYDNITKAKEIIKAFLDSSDLNIKHKAEEFLGEF